MRAREFFDKGLSMMVMRSASVAAVTACLWLIGPGDAFARQAPALTATVSATTVTIEWTGMAGAAAYQLSVSGGATADVNVPATTTRLVVAAPPGTYVLRVRGIAGSLIGPYSNTVTITVGSPGCLQPTAPHVVTSVSGPVVSVNWNSVPGVVGYRLEFSRASGSTELAQTVGASQTAYSQYVPLLGTFFVRVVAGSACGTATSQEESFRIETLTSNGPRTPDPPTGQLIPRASLGYAGGVLAQVAAQYNGDLQNSCREHGGNNIFMFRVLQRLRQIDSRWGLNDKRGNAGDMSQDIVSYNPTSRPDNAESQVYLFDVISGHCGTGRADVWFNDVTDVTWAQRGNPACGTTFCARWTIDQYLRAGFPPDERP